MEDWGGGKTRAFLILIPTIIFTVTSMKYSEENPLLAGTGFCLAALFLFAFLLDLKAKRTVKGLLTMGVGVLLTLVYNVGLKHNLMCDLGVSGAQGNCNLGMSEKDNLIAATTLENITMLISLACIGAGAGIIAAHGDRSSTDYQLSQSEDISDIRYLLGSVAAKLDRQERMINLIFISLTLALISSVILFLVISAHSGG